MKKAVIPAIGFAMIILLGAFTKIPLKNSGIKGTVYLIKGDQMPGPGKPANPKKGLQTTVYIYALTNTKDVTRSTDNSTFYTAIKTRLIKKIASDKKGNFRVSLPPGQYSIFVKKGKLFYGNLFDDKNNIAPVTVEKGKYTSVEVRADYDAVY